MQMKRCKQTVSLLVCCALFAATALLTTGCSGTKDADGASVSTSGEMLLVPVGSDLLDLTFTVECNVVNPITTEIGPQEVRIGKTHIVKTDKFELTNGVIIDCVWGDGTEG